MIDTRSHLKNTSPRVRLRFSKPNPESKRAFEGLRLTASSIFEMASNLMVRIILFDFSEYQVIYKF
jgi:hypothetical protein